MIANLPLIFANKVPSSLANLRIPELERFITFMVQCSLGHDTVRQVKKPAWWPREVEFSNPLRRPRVIPQNWGNLLRHLVRQCYEYHHCTYLLRFSAKLARHTRERLRFVDNQNRTTSILEGTTGKLLVTLRNENLLYDQPHRHRVPQKPLKTSQLRPTQIYLCDYCDSHFDSYVGLQTHERLCGPQAAPSEPADAPEEEDLTENTLDNFINALGLARVEEVDEIESDDVPNKHGNTRLQRAASAANSSFQLPFSSIAGRKHYRTQHKYNQDYAFERVERYCHALPLSHEQPRWIRRNPQQTYPVRARRSDYDHSRKYRVATARHKIILDLQSQLLYLHCKPLRIAIDRIPSDVFEKYLERYFEEEAENGSDEDVEFVGVTSNDEPAETEKKVVKDEVVSPEDVIDLCSDDETSVGNENTDPKPKQVNRTKNGLPHSTPQPCGAARQRNVTVTKTDLPPSAVPVIQPFNSLQVVSTD